MPRKYFKLAATVGLSLSVIGCGNTLERIARVGQEPSMSPIENPKASELYQPVSLPMPEPMSDLRQPASLWRQGSRAFFKDQRAGRVGDILTVVIEIDDEAELDNSTSRARSADESAGLDNLLGYESRINNIFDGDAIPTDLVNADSDSTSTGTGSTAREEEIDLRMAAVITQIMPNGNLVIQGSQQVPASPTAAKAPSATSSSRATASRCSTSCSPSKDHAIHRVPSFLTATQPPLRKQRGTFCCTARGSVYPSVMVVPGTTIHEFVCARRALPIETRGWSCQVRP
jgi:flagellar L-ring protein FlgH